MRTILILAVLATTAAAQPPTIEFGWPPGEYDAFFTGTITTRIGILGQRGQESHLDASNGRGAVTDGIVDWAAWDVPEQHFTVLDYTTGYTADVHLNAIALRCHEIVSITGSMRIFDPFSSEDFAVDLSPTFECGGSGGTPFRLNSSVGEMPLVANDIMAIELGQLRVKGDVAPPPPFSGDANEDGRFDSADLVQVFVAGKYATGERATWREGDWTDDGYFNSSDLVSAFQTGRYETGPHAVATVPEPASTVLAALATIAVAALTRCRRPCRAAS